MKKTDKSEPATPKIPAPPRSDLERWMRAAGWTDETLADEFGVSRSFIASMRTRNALPSLPFAVELERISAGKVSCRSLVPPDRVLLVKSARPRASKGA